MQKQWLGVAAGCAMGFTGGAWAADAATADEVVAKVKEAATAVQSGGDGALAAFDDAKGKWAWKDTYVFVLDCTAGTMLSHPNPKVKGMKLADLKDKDGKAFGPSLCEAAKGATGGWVEYTWTKVGSEDKARKVSYILTAGKLAVAAGVYSDAPLKDLQAKTAK